MLWILELLAHFAWAIEPLLNEYSSGPSYGAYLKGPGIVSLAVGQMDDDVIASVGDGQAIALGLDVLLTRGFEKYVNEG